MNEYQVGMGESSCAAKLWTTPITVGNGKALFNIGELMTVALERSKTAREAILVSPSSSLSSFLSFVLFTLIQIFDLIHSTLDDGFTCNNLWLLW